MPALCKPVHCIPECTCTYLWCGFLNIAASRRPGTDVRCVLHFMHLAGGDCGVLLQGRARFQLYQKLLALAAAVIQAVGQLTYIRPFVADWDVTWLAVNSLTLVAGAMILVHVCPTYIHFSVSNRVAGSPAVQLLILRKGRYTEMDGPHCAYKRLLNKGAARPQYRTTEGRMAGFRNLLLQCRWQISSRS